VRVTATLLSIGLFVVLWNVAAAWRILPFFPTMPQVATAIAKDADQLIDGSLATIGRALLGLALGTALGAAAALVMAWSRGIAAVADPYVTLAKSVPGMALIPVFILWFGLAEAARIGFVATLTFFVIFVATAEAIPSVPRVYHWASATLGASRAQTYRHVVLPAMLPHMFGGLRNAITLSFAVAVAAEFIGAQSGLGGTSSTSGSTTRWTAWSLGSSSSRSWLSSSTEPSSSSKVGCSPGPSAPDVRVTARASVPGDRRLGPARLGRPRRGTVLGATGIVLGVGLWVIVTEARLLPPYAIAGPDAIAARFADESAFLLENVWLTLVRVLIAYVLGCALGIAVAVAASWALALDLVAEPVIQILKPVPPLVLTPFMVIWLGATEVAVVALATWGAFFLMVVETREALRRTPIVYRWAAATMGESPLGINLRVMLPASLPRLIGGLRISLVLAINLVILAEFSVASGGVGELIVEGYRFLRPDQLFFGILVAVAMTVILDVVIRIASVRIRRWT
jgi:ABC-type nitrate/sulfonate/bicarbonate transport system permease component